MEGEPLPTLGHANYYLGADKTSGEVLSNYYTPPSASTVQEHAQDSPSFVQLIQGVINISVIQQR